LIRKEGRAIIAAALTSFYNKGGWLDYGMPSIRYTLFVETPRFIAGHSSYPACSR